MGDEGELKFSGGISALLGARVRRVDGPEPGLLAFSLFTPTLRAVLLLRFTGERTGAGLVAERPHGLPATSFIQKLRKELENARVIAFEQPDPSSLALLLLRSEQTTRVHCDFARGSIALEREGKVLIRTGAAANAPPTRKLQVSWPETLEALQLGGERLIVQQAAEGLDARRSALSRILRAAQKKLQKRMIALQGDMARADEAAPLRARANLLLTQQHAVRRGQDSVQLTDYSLDPPTLVTVALDPKRTLQEQIETWFKQAKRYERGAQLASQRSAATQREIAEIEQLLARIAAADSGELESLADQARALGLAGVGRALSGERESAGRKAPARPERKPYRQFAGWKDRTILVGKSAQDNDALTREHARPQDLWLHARGETGAHVVVPLERNEACPEELLIDAAHLAAHFSDARGEPTVEVSYTGKRYVRKPRGSAPGQVTLEREKVIALQLEPTRIERLLSHERRD
jgi:predicted ribosome quality control (RQC) complex YloA/Tae2 family protein